MVSNLERIVYLPSEAILNLGEAPRDVRQLLNVRLRILGTVQQGLCFFAQHINFVFKDTDLVLEVRTIKLVDVDDVVVAVLADGATEAYTTRAVFAETLDFVVRVVEALEPILLR